MVLTNVTAPTLANLTYLVNVTSPSEFFVKTNVLVFNGYLWFILLWLVVFIAFVVGQSVKDQPLNNALYGLSVVSVLALLLRGVSALVFDVRYSLLSDYQFWVFPLLTILLAVVVWGIKEK